jgi:type I restriction enzyme S subunit
MELKEGFIKNDIGVIPNDWEIKNIGSICEIYGRIGFRGYTVKDIMPKEEGAITISPSNIQDGKMDFSKCTYISWFKYEESPEIKIYNGDILLVKTGSTFGKTAIIKELFEKATINPQLVVLKNIKVDNVFLGYIMAYKIVQNQIKSTIVGGAIPTLSQQLVSNYKIPLPPTKAEQTAIATALSDADAYINALEKLIEKKRNIKQGAMQQLLKPKKGWVVKKLGEIATIQRGASPRPIENPIWFDENSKVGWVRISDVTNSIKYLTETTQKLSLSGIKNSRAVNEGELIMSICATIGRPILTTFKVCIHDGFVAFYNPTVLREYLYYYLTFIESEWAKSGQTGSQMNLNSNIINTREISFPLDPKEQKNISDTFSDIDKEIFALEKKLSKSKMLKQGMMQELLTGKIRLIKK